MRIHNPLIVPVGSVAEPAVTFDADTNTGIYSPAQNEIAVSAGGADALNIGIDGLIAADMRVLHGSGGSLTTTTLATWVGFSATFKPFVAPASGIVMIFQNQYCKSSVAGTSAEVGFEIRTGSVAGSGTLFTGYATTQIIVNANVQWIKSGGMDLIAGLTPGASYHVRSMFKSSAAGTTVTISAGDLFVLPVF